ncbi:DUF6134 family protein [Limisalsivibrio acetivorans]|uniref:DUF6134 family protein n=1 Tax=Limisalsivibrio acetivorans TaxID=1304888 RepID=UPI0003B38D0B|nr:DUF6134 family protein [Limisalsivibrio acetivorans]
MKRLLFIIVMFIALPLFAEEDVVIESTYDVYSDNVHLGSFTFKRSREDGIVRHEKVINVKKKDMFNEISFFLEEKSVFDENGLLRYSGSLRLDGDERSVTAEREGANYLVQSNPGGSKTLKPDEYDSLSVGTPGSELCGTGKAKDYRIFKLEEFKLLNYTFKHIKNESGRLGSDFTTVCMLTFISEVNKGAIWIAEDELGFVPIRQNVTDEQGRFSAVLRDYSRRQTGD